MAQSTEGLGPRERPQQEERLPNGRKRYEVAYTDPDTRLRRTKGGFTTKRAAQDWADQFMSTARRGDWIDPERSRVTFAVVARQWLDASTSTASGLATTTERSSRATTTSLAPSTRPPSETSPRAPSARSSR